MAQQTIQHTLWVINASARAMIFKSLDVVISRLNNLFLANCVGDVNANFAIGAATGALATPPITPAPYDAVVFLVGDVGRSLGPKIGQQVKPTTVSNPLVLGSTFMAGSVAGLAEVYWDRCINNEEAAGAIFHEAAHLKSGLADAMHTWKSAVPHGGPGLKVLSATGGKFPTPSWDDFEFYSNAITKQITVRTNIP
jgi:hypothetical protein